MTLDAIRAEIRNLPSQQRFDLLAELADDLEAERTGRTLSTTEHAELVERLERYRTAPQHGKTWTEVRRQVQAKP